MPAHPPHASSQALNNCRHIACVLDFGTGLQKSYVQNRTPIAPDTLPDPLRAALAGIAAGALLVPVQAAMRLELLALDHLQTDETPVGVQTHCKKKGRIGCD